MKIDIIHLENNNGIKISLCTLGARLHELFVPDKYGASEDIILGCENVQDYLDPNFKYFGTSVGPFANRIANGQFSIDGKQFHLNQNERSNCLHGGINAYESEIWNIINSNKQQTVFRLNTSDVYNGFPGKVTVDIKYELNDDNELIISYKATTDQKTHINLTHHSYFNLSGKHSNSAMSHELKINADSYLLVDELGIPTKQQNLNSDLSFDFREFKAIGRDIHNEHQQLELTGGYDHNYILNTQGSLEEIAAILRESSSGRQMHVYTTEPGLQFFSGNFDKTTTKGKNNQSYETRTGICLEPQGFPNAPNRPDFPSTLVEPGQEYQSVTKFIFSNY